MSNRYFLRHWTPGMDKDEILESLDFDPGCAAFGAREAGGAVDWKTDSFLFIAYGPDLWYASKVVAVCRLDMDMPDFHIAVYPKHRDKGIGAALIYAALKTLPKADLLETVATKEGETILTGMFGFSDGSFGEVKKLWHSRRGWLGGVKPTIETYLAKIVQQMACA